MDIAFNTVNATKEQLKNMRSDNLQRQSSKTLESEESKQYKIIVPSIPCEFPDMAAKEAQIYPLPISHENQCTTLGATTAFWIFFKKNLIFSLTNSRNFSLFKALERILTLTERTNSFDEYQISQENPT